MHIDEETGMIYFIIEILTVQTLPDKIMEEETSPRAPNSLAASEPLFSGSASDTRNISHVPAPSNPLEGSFSTANGEKKQLQTGGVSPDSLCTTSSVADHASLPPTSHVRIPLFLRLCFGGRADHKSSKIVPH